MFLLEQSREILPCKKVCMENEKCKRWSQVKNKLCQQMGGRLGIEGYLILRVLDWMHCLLTFLSNYEMVAR